jgi:GNAT superfamily N-acetyltransferase
MDLVRRANRGLDYLAAATELLQRARAEHPTSGVWEAADLQWWWRKPRATDGWDQLFWYDVSGYPVAAAIATDWDGRLGLDVLALPTLGAEGVRQAWLAGLEAITGANRSPVEVMVDADDQTMTRLLDEAGFIAQADKGVSAWLDAAARPAVSGLAAGYRLTSWAETSSGTHHMAGRAGRLVAERLAQTSLYRPDLDLFVLDADSQPAASGLFWYDPLNAIGMVEPMRTEEGHERRGLARHVLTAGLHRLAAAGATRIKINYEASNEAARALYLSAGFTPAMTTSVHVSEARGDSSESTEHGA